LYLVFRELIPILNIDPHSWS